MKFARFSVIAVAAVLACSHAFAASGPGTGTSAYQCAPYQVLQGAPYPTSGPYTAGGDGVVTGVNPNDSRAFDLGGCRLLGAGGNSYELIGRLIGANMNVTTDQPFVWLAAPGSVWRATKITCTNASTSLTTASGGIYTELSKGGTALSVNAAFSGLTAAALAYDLTINTVPGTTFYSSQPATASATGAAVLALTTAQGAAATADCYLYGQVGQ